MASDIWPHINQGLVSFCTTQCNICIYSTQADVCRRLNVQVRNGYSLLYKLEIYNRLHKLEIYTLDCTS